MNILFLSQVVPFPPHGGVFQRGYNILRQIHRLGHKVYLLSFLHEDLLPSSVQVEKSRKELLEFCEKVVFVTMPVKSNRFRFYSEVFKSFFSDDPFFVLAHSSPEFRAAMIQMLGEKDYDLIHFDTISLAQYLDIITGHKKIVTHHNIESSLMYRKSQVTEKSLHRAYFLSQALKLKRYEELHCHLFDGNIVMSAADEENLSNIVGDLPTYLIPNGVDTQYFRPTAEPDSLLTGIIHAATFKSLANYDAVRYLLY